MVTVNDVQYVSLSDEEIQKCIENAHHITPHIKDRSNLHTRDYLERFIDVLMGEIAEIAVIKWLKSRGKYAVSAVDKTSDKPDSGHDVIVKDIKGVERKCSVKSSLSVFKHVDGILKEFNMAITESEVRDINIQVYFWLDVKPSKESSRTNVPSLNNMAIICWCGRKDVKDFKSYKTEEREVLQKPLYELKTLNSLLDILI